MHQLGKGHATLIHSGPAFLAHTSPHSSERQQSASCTLLSPNLSANAFLPGGAPVRRPVKFRLQVPTAKRAPDPKAQGLAQGISSLATTLQIAKPGCVKKKVGTLRIALGYGRLYETHAPCFGTLGTLDRLPRPAQVAFVPRPTRAKLVRSGRQTRQSRSQGAWT